MINTLPNDTSLQRICHVYDRERMCRRIFSSVQGYHQHCGGCSFLWGILSVLWRDTISTVEDVHYSGAYYQYCGGFSVLCRDTISIVEDVHYSGAYHQYCRGCSILYLCIIITVRDSVSTVTEVECHQHLESVRFCRGYSGLQV